MVSKKRNQTQYNIEMDIRAIIILSLLSSATAVIIFYLGMTFGLSMRKPDSPSNQPLTIDSETFPYGDATRDLAIYNLREKTSSNENYSNPTTEKKSVLSSNNQTPKPSVPSQEEKGKTYTIQIFATTSKEKANQYVQKLKEKNYPAYLQPASAGGIFRVRVGKMKSRKEAEKLLPKLKTIMSGSDKPKIIEISNSI